MIHQLTKSLEHLGKERNLPGPAKSAVLLPLLRCDGRGLLLSIAETVALDLSGDALTERRPVKPVLLFLELVATFLEGLLITPKVERLGIHQDAVEVEEYGLGTL